MVVKMMKWRPWPPLTTRKFQVKLVLRKIEGSEGFLAPEKVETAEITRLAVEINWKGQGSTLSSLRRKVTRNFTEEKPVVKEKKGEIVEWNEEFFNVVSMSAFNKEETLFQPWEIAFSVLNGFSQGSKNKCSVVGTASLNLAEYTSMVEEKGFELAIPVSLPAVDAPLNQLGLSLALTLSLLELRTTQEASETIQRSIVPIPSSPREALPTEKDELSALKAGLRKVKILRDYVSSRRAKKTCLEEEGSDGRFSDRSDDAEYAYPFDTDSPDNFNGEVEGNESSSFRKSFSYGTLASANCAGGSFYSEMWINRGDGDWVYHSNRKSDVGCLHVEEATSSISEQSIFQTSKRSLLSWRKRKLNFRSPKAKGEPLLKKAYGEEGGDDIDYDRRQMSSPDESLTSWWNKSEDESVANRSSVSDFGDDNFSVGSWEKKELISRDEQLKLCAQVFFASIDQRSERAAGESACTALVAVIADWFQTNRGSMPIKSQFDSLIREGSLEWRNLCENETYKERFPDKHFDLETILQAKIRPLSVVQEKSFIGFFLPDCKDEQALDFLQGAMCFDSIWDEISHAGSISPATDEPQVYIVSWNDHFFVLKVEPEAYYILDTLGERLYEGCTEAYVLKFDKDTTIYRVPEEGQGETKPTAGDQLPAAAGDQQLAVVDAKAERTVNSEGKEEVVCRGKESCKEYIKGFLTAIPLRELQVDMKKGLMASMPLHHRLQIEFHYTEQLQLPETMITETPVAFPVTSESYTV